MDNKDEDDKDKEIDDEFKEEVTIIPDLNTLFKRNLPSIIVIKRRYIKRRPRKERDKNT